MLASELLRLIHMKDLVGPGLEPPVSWDDPEEKKKFFRSIGMAKPPPTPSAAQFKAQASALSREIFASWIKLKGVVERREETIRKRWMKKTQEARRALLLKAWPNMPLMHRPDFWALLHPASRVQNKDRYVSSFKYPHINLEDLVKARSFLLLINSRARNPPSTFAHADMHATHIGQLREVFEIPYLTGRTMYLSGQDTVSTYGRVVSWEDKKAVYLLCNGLQFIPGFGLISMECEKTILHFLLSCCELIFADLSVPDLYSSNLPVVPEPSKIVSQDTSYSQLSALAADAPYRIPENLDITALKNLIATRRSAAEDHIWDLREDPAFFLSSIIEMDNNAPYKVLDPNGRKYPVEDVDVVWQTQLSIIVMNAYTSFLIWDQLFNRILTIESAMPQRLNPRHLLPPVLQQGFLELLHALRMSSERTIDLLAMFFPGAPGIRPYFMRGPSVTGISAINTWPKKDAGKSPLVYAMCLLASDKQRMCFGLPNLVDEMQRVIDRDKKEKEKMSPLLLHIFADVALMAQIQHQVDSFFPWSVNFTYESLQFKAIQSEKDMPDFEYIGNLGGQPPFLVSLCMPLQQKFNYPVDKAYNLANVNAMRQAEANLDRFWSVVDGYYQKEGQSLEKLLRERGVCSRTIQRTPPYSSPEPKRKEQKRDVTDQMQQQVSSMNLTPEPDKPRRFVVEESQKAKTRGKTNTDNTSGSQTPHMPDIQYELEPNKSVFKVSKRALRVFHSLFYVPSEHRPETSGEIAWPDFLHAMTQVEFSIEKLHGSVWQFTPTNKDITPWHGIQFHEPHPSGKLSFNQARRIGRRLSRTYDWSGDMFV